MKTFICLFLVCACTLCLQAQSIIGDWQLTKQSDCMEEKMTAVSDSTQQMIDEMKSMTPPTPQIVSFKEKLSGEESTRILNRKKAVHNKSFSYKFDGERLLILDKKSHTLTDSYTVEKFSADSLIISNSSRPCETRIFLRVK
jgi:hypothetical protein